MSAKHCNKCDTTKPLADYQRCSKNGTQGWCRACMAASQRERAKQRRKRRKLAGHVPTERPMGRTRVERIKHLPCDCSERYTLPDGSCAIAYANDGPLSLHQVGELLGLSGEMVRRIEVQALDKLAKRMRELRPPR